MAKIVIHIADTGDHFRPRVNAERYKPGDVVEVLPDDHKFGALDIGPHNKVVSLPNISVEEIAHLTNAHPGRKFTGEKMNPQLRIWHIPAWGLLMPTDHSDAATFLKTVKPKPQV